MRALVRACTKTHPFAIHSKRYHFFKNNSNIVKLFKMSIESDLPVKTFQKARYSVDIPNWNHESDSTTRNNDVQQVTI